MPTSSLAGVWDDVVDDMEATAEQFRDDGWSTVEVHSGNVTALQGEESDRWGLDVLAPDNEFEELEALLADGHEFTECEVYRGDTERLVLLVVAMLDPTERQAVLFPAYYDREGAAGMLARAREADEMRSHIHPLDQRRVITFRHQDLDLFLPDD